MNVRVHTSKNREKIVAYNSREYTRLSARGAIFQVEGFPTKFLVVIKNPRQRRRVLTFDEATGDLRTLSGKPFKHNLIHLPHAELSFGIER